MTDAEYQEQISRLEKLSEYWIPRLGLSWWDIRMEYARAGYRSPDRTIITENDNTSIAHCKADWRYAHAVVVWNMQTLPEIGDEELDRIFVHELMHIFLNEMRWARVGEDVDHIDHEERVASTLMKGIFWFREILLKEGRSSDQGKPQSE